MLLVAIYQIPDLEEELGMRSRRNFSGEYLNSDVNVTHLWDKWKASSSTLKIGQKQTCLQKQGKYWHDSPYIVWSI